MEPVRHDPWEEAQLDDRAVILNEPCVRGAASGGQCGPRLHSFGDRLDHDVGLGPRLGQKTLARNLPVDLPRDPAAGSDIAVICGGVIPPKDYDELTEAGVIGIFGPGMNVPEAAAEVVELLHNRRTGGAA